MATGAVVNPANVITGQQFAAALPIQQRCTVPTDGMVITQDTTFCPGEYLLPKGIVIGANGVTMDCNGATILGVAFPPSGIPSVGIQGNGVSNVTVENCRVKDHHTGINFTASPGVTLRYNTLTFTQFAGIELQASPQSQVLDNVLVSQSSILVSLSSDTLVKGNDLTQSSAHLEVYSSDNSVVANNHLGPATVGLAVTEGSGYIVSGNIVEGLQFVVTRSKNVKVINNVMMKSQPVSTTIRSSEQVEFRNNTFNASSFLSLQSKDVIIKDNNFISDGSWIEIDLKGSQDILFENNKLETQILYLVDHFIYYPNASLYAINKSSNITVKNNYLTDGWFYINSSNHTIISNTIDNTDPIGSTTAFRAEDGASNNIILHNNFLTQTGVPNAVRDHGINNVWDDGSLGNHYSIYDEASEGCVDVDADLICDLPYQIAGTAGSVDSFPSIPQL